MGIEYKTVGVASVEKVKDEGNGIVTAYVSVTGLEDNVKDIIEPGAYEETLHKRMPKGVWGHQWLKPISKTLEIDELMPGDKGLPETLANGDAWPAQAGALRIKMQFNLKTPRGRNAYHDVVFFDDQQEWSIGYSVPEGGAVKTKDGVRRIKKLDLFEYSPVLFGAMPNARTASVKDAQLAFKSLFGEDIAKLEQDLQQFKMSIGVEEGDRADDAAVEADDFVGDEDIEVDIDELDDDDDDDDEHEGKNYGYANDDDDDDEEEEVDEEDDDDDDEDDEEMVGKISPAAIRNAIKSLEAVLPGMGEEKAYNDIDLSQVVEDGATAFMEAKATEYSTLVEAIDHLDVPLEKGNVEALQNAAETLDRAYGVGDLQAAEEAGTELLDVLETAIEDEGPSDGVRTVARMIGDRLEELSSDGESNDDDDEGKSWFDGNVEYKVVQFGTREHGMPTLDGVVERKMDAFIAGLNNGTLLSLDYYLQANVEGNNRMKAFVQEMIDERLGSSEMSHEEKARYVRTPAGAKRFKQPIGSIIIGKGRKLANLKVGESQFDGWDLVSDSKGRKYDVGFDDELGKYVATRNGGWKPVVSGSSLDDVYEQLDSHVGGGKVAKKLPVKKPAAKKPGSVLKKPATKPATGAPSREAIAKANELVSWVTRISKNKRPQSNAILGMQLDADIKKRLSGLDDETIRAVQIEASKARRQGPLTSAQNYTLGRIVAIARIVEFDKSQGGKGRKGSGAAIETKRSFSPEELASLGEAGKAFKNGNGEWSYPIETIDDLDNAVKAFGRSMEEDRERLKSYIKTQAKALGKEDLIPADWRSDEKAEVNPKVLEAVGIDPNELKSLENFVKGLK